MSNIRVEHRDGIATVHLSRGKVNALIPEMVDELRVAFRELAARQDVAGVVLTGDGAFFSFGFDVPALYDLTPAAFLAFLRSFAALYTELFELPKPLVAALNGHAAAGGCMLALTAGGRGMAEGRGRMGLNEVAFGSSLFAGSVEMLRFVAGDAAASRAALGGALLEGGEALRLGLVDELVAGDRLLEVARARAA